MTTKKLREFRTLLMLLEGLKRVAEGGDLPNDPRDLLTPTTKKEVV